MTYLADCLQQLTLSNDFELPLTACFRRIIPFECKQKQLVNALPPTLTPLTFGNRIPAYHPYPLIPRLETTSSSQSAPSQPHSLILPSPLNSINQLTTLQPNLDKGSHNQSSPPPLLPVESLSAIHPYSSLLWCLISSFIELLGPTSTTLPTHSHPPSLIFEAYFNQECYSLPPSLSPISPPLLS